MSDLLNFTRREDNLEDDFGALRGKEVLTKLIGQHQEWERPLRLADKTLRSDPHYAAAMHAVARSLQARAINAFISYRSKRDANAAQALASALRELSNGCIHVTLADEFAAKISGKDFKEEIGARIQEAHWFVLMASDHSPNPWCMFETGMFRSTMISKRINRLICICHPGVTLPEPIHEFQSVFATVPSLVQLFEGLFRQPEPLPGWEPLNPRVGSQAIEVAATRIAEAFPRPSEPLEFNRRVTVSIPHSQNLRGPGDLALARVETDEMTARLFGKARPPQTWGELIAGVERRNNLNEWLVELTQVLAKARQNYVFRPVSGTFESYVGGTVVRPIVYSMDASGVDTTFQLLFVEDICSAPTHRIHPQTLSLITAIRMNNRIRWEVVERFRSSRWSHETVDCCAKVFSRIERECGSFGRWDVDLLCANFGPGVQPLVRVIVARWRQLRTADTAGEQQMTGELDLAFKRYDLDRISVLLGECAALTHRFLRLANPAMERLVEGNDHDLGETDPLYGATMA